MFMFPPVQTNAIAQIFLSNSLNEDGSTYYKYEFELGVIFAPSEKSFVDGQGKKIKSSACLYINGDLKTNENLNTLTGKVTINNKDYVIIQTKKFFDNNSNVHHIKMELL